MSKTALKCDGCSKLNTLPRYYLESSGGFFSVHRWSSTLGSCMTSSWGANTLVYLKQSDVMNSLLSVIWNKTPSRLLQTGNISRKMGLWKGTIFFPLSIMEGFHNFWVQFWAQLYQARIPSMIKKVFQQTVSFRD